jgi:class 3 adenylate cyclase
MSEPDTANVKLATLFADVAESTRLYELFGDATAYAAIDGCLSAMKGATREFGGRTIKTIGDELMAVFPTAEAACQAAIEMQWRIADLPPVGEVKLSIRIGFHYGAAVEHEGDVFGDSVNVAARLTEVANPRQIIVSGQVTAQLSAPLAASTRRLWPLPLKGKAEPIDVIEVLWAGDEEAAVTLSAQFEPPRVPLRLRLRYRGDEVVVDAAHPKVDIGRDPANEVVVDARNASRVHARVEWRRDKFVLIDLSTNGTYVVDAQDQETRLRREEFILDGDGKISFGRSLSAGGGGAVEFYCEYSNPVSSISFELPTLQGR